MKKVAPVAILLVLVSMFLTSCGQPEEFKTATKITTTETTTEEVTYKYSELDVLGTKMGMSVEETQNALGIKASLYLNDSSVAYFVVNKKSLPFVTDGCESSVYFIYDSDMRLCEVQYLSTVNTGFVLKDALSTYDRQYGKHAELKVDESKTNYIWYKDGVYILITTVSTGQNAMSFFGEDYFNKTNPEEAKAYANL